MQFLYDELFGIYGELECFLDYKNPYELMVAVILSAQCTDRRVNNVTPKIFEKYPSLKKMAMANQKTLEKLIFTCGFYRNKSKNIIQASSQIVNDFKSEVPQKMDELISLAGVGRKTANVILGDAFKIPGFPVDTHVIRLLNKIGFVHFDNPEKIEKVVMKSINKKYWTNFSHLLIMHGRMRCKARNPDCENCEICKICKNYKENLQ